jgi:TRAP-type uncharacterized transport system substrate-binding protein
MQANRIIAWIRERKLALLCSLGLAVVGLVLATPVLHKLDTPVIRLSAGPAATRRHAIAVALHEAGSRNHVDLEVLPSEGTEDCLGLLKAGHLDAALVSNGVLVPDDENIVVLGALQIEAVHLLVRPEIAKSGPLVEGIRGKRVNFGPPGSIERLLAKEFVSFARLRLPFADNTGDIVPTKLSKEELFEKSAAILNASGSRRAELIAELPDCVPVVESMPSVFVQRLVEAAGYEIVPMPATRAFLMDNLQPHLAGQTVLQREFLERTSIPSHCYYAQHPVPAADCETVGVRLIVVARHDLPTNAVRPFMKAIFEGEFAHRIKPISPRDLDIPYAIHPAALAYLDRDKPLLVQSFFEWASQGLSLSGAFGAGVLSLYGILRRGKARKPADYFAEIRKVELALQTVPMAPELDTRNNAINQLNQCLLDLRQQLIEDICEGRIKGDQVISNILMLLNESRRTTGEFVREHDGAGHLASVKKSMFNKAA